eukprot:TRINITY_DN21788_c0_g2_i1.p1 TRINITY_DN21788_c0_g2~~TRINITY_DN21788_c0_g2_i1.p1  ORF type:complete len:491 (-),score=84.58 TRINITY_DN21788_c0_g2_i1:262-1734(-)
MIEYDFGKWGVGFIWQCRGSIFPKSAVAAFPGGIGAVALCILAQHYLTDYDDIQSGLKYFGSLWGGYTVIIGFLLVFRTQIAYSRYWEGCCVVSQVKTGWTNAVSNLIAFCTQASDKEEAVEKFQGLLVRLMSLLFCESLKALADKEDENFEVLDLEGIDKTHLMFLDTVSQDEKPELLIQWVQRLVVTQVENGVISAPPPITSRIFQELSNGIIKVRDAERIREVPFPFPYSQMISVLLMLHAIVMPVVAALLFANFVAAFLLTYGTLFCLFSLNFIAAEIEMPFGDDSNDVNIEHYMRGFNQSMVLLTSPIAKKPPSFDVIKRPSLRSGVASSGKTATETQPMPPKPQSAKAASDAPGMLSRESTSQACMPPAGPGLSEEQQTHAAIQPTLIRQADSSEDDARKNVPYHVADATKAIPATHLQPLPSVSKSGLTTPLELPTSLIDCDPKPMEPFLLPDPSIPHSPRVVLGGGQPPRASVPQANSGYRP